MTNCDLLDDDFLSSMLEEVVLLLAATATLPFAAAKLFTEARAVADKLESPAPLCAARTEFEPLPIIELQSMSLILGR